MTEEQFIGRNQEHWQRLEAYNELMSRKNVKRLEKEQVREFAGLFQMAGRHLAFAKTHFSESKVVLYLNQLVGSAHPFFYQKAKSDLKDAAAYLTRYFPRFVRQNYLYFAASALTFIVGAVVCAVMVLADESNAGLFLPQSILDNLKIGGDQMLTEYSVLSAVIMTNNINVILQAVALGVTAGIGTLFILLYNGAIIGALAGYLAVTGQDMILFWSLILPHGILELTAIFLGGAAGLMIGRSLLIPNDRKRKDAVMAGAKQAAFVLPGIVIMLVIAGLIEGYFTTLPIAAVRKLVFAAATLVLLIGYFWRAGNDSRR